MTAGASTNPFAAQGPWLDRKRAECLRDLDDLKALLRKIEDDSSACAEDRRRRLWKALEMNQATYNRLLRIEALREWGER